MVTNIVATVIAKYWLVVKKNFKITCLLSEG